MAASRRDALALVKGHSPTASATPATDATGISALTAAASPLPPDRRLTPAYETWQQASWDFHTGVEQLSYGVGFVANLLSRVRLIIAADDPRYDEPVPVTEGPAVELLGLLAGGVLGQGRMMHRTTVNFMVPGECWLVGEPNAPDQRGVRQAVGTTPPDSMLSAAPVTWFIASADELRVAPGSAVSGGSWQVRVNDGKLNTAWRDLSPGTLVNRIWNPDPRFGYRADSATRHALGALTRLDFINKLLLASSVSRLSNRGAVLYDMERLSFGGTRSDGASSLAANPGDGPPPDPFAERFVETARTAIADPTSPAACLPIPIGYSLAPDDTTDPSKLITHVTFDGDDYVARLLEQQDAAVKQVAAGIELPAEWVDGSLGDMNHWGLTQLSEETVRVYIVPPAEMIFGCFTEGYLAPMLSAAGESLTDAEGNRLIIWGDFSEITTRPDKSVNVRDAYDRAEVGPTTYRREIGVEEEDAPDDKAMVRMLLIQQARRGSVGALQVLNGDIELADLPTTSDPGVRPGTQPLGPDHSPTPGLSSPTPDQGSAPDDPAPSLAASASPLYLPPTIASSAPRANVKIVLATANSHEIPIISPTLITPPVPTSEATSDTPSDTGLLP